MAESMYDHLFNHTHVPVWAQDPDIRNAIREGEKMPIGDFHSKEREPREGILHQNRWSRARPVCERLVEQGTISTKVINVNGVELLHGEDGSLYLQLKPKNTWWDRQIIFGGRGSGLERATNGRQVGALYGYLISNLTHGRGVDINYIPTGDFIRLLAYYPFWDVCYGGTEPYWLKKKAQVDLTIWRHACVIEQIKKKQFTGDATRKKNMGIGWCISPLNHHTKLIKGIHCMVKSTITSTPIMCGGGGGGSHVENMFAH